MRSVPRSLGPVGRWTIGFSPVDPFDAVRAFDELAEVTEKVMLALAAEHLLDAADLVFSRWYDDSISSLVPDQIEGQIPLSRVPIDSFASTLRAFVSARAPTHVYPMAFTVSGRGTVLLPSGARMACDDLIWLAGTLSTAGNQLSLGTQHDAWLSHTLLGEPQPELHRLNAPRLERALKAAEGATGEWWDTEEHTKLAVMNPYGISNFTTDTGAIYVSERARSLMAE